MTGHIIRDTRTAGVKFIVLLYNLDIQEIGVSSSATVPSNPATGDASAFGVPSVPSASSKVVWPETMSGRLAASLLIIFSLPLEFAVRPSAGVDES